MQYFLQRKRNVLALFCCGFLAGVLLEIALLERHWLPGETTPQHLNGAKITCLVILNHPHDKYVKAAKDTWLRHCDEHSLVNVTRSKKSSQTKGDICRGGGKEGALLGEGKTCEGNEGKVGEVKVVGGASAWAGLCKALRGLEGDKDWLIVVPDNLMVVVENLRRFVTGMDPSQPHYLGHAISNHMSNYNSLSAGILLSRGALHKLLGEFPSGAVCEQGGKYWKNEDVYLGKHLGALGIKVGDTRDGQGRGKFHGYNIHSLLEPGKLFNQTDYKKKAIYPISQGIQCCSPELITIDPAGPDKMYYLYYLLYKLKTNLGDTMAAKGKPGDFSWKNFLREEGFSKEQIEGMSAQQYYDIWAAKLPPKELYKRIRSDFQPET